MNQHRWSLEPEGILKFSSYLCILRLKPSRTKRIADPTLIERNKQVVPRSQSPAHTALPAQVTRVVVVLNKVREGQSRRYREVKGARKYPRYEVAFRQVGKSLIRSKAHRYMRRKIVDRTQGYVFRGARPEVTIAKG